MRISSVPHHFNLSSFQEQLSISSASVYGYYGPLANMKAKKGTTNMLTDENNMGRIFESETALLSPPPPYRPGISCDGGLSMLAQTFNLPPPTNPAVATNSKQRSHSLSQSSCRSLSTSSFTLMSGEGPGSISRDGDRRNSNLGTGTPAAVVKTTMISSNGESTVTTTKTSTATTAATSSFSSVISPRHSTTTRSYHMPYPTLVEQPTIPVHVMPRESISNASESTDSSPTTTNSTFDSPTITEASPSSSPESPSSVTQLPSMKTNGHFYKPEAQTTTPTTAPNPDSLLQPKQSPPTATSQWESPTRRARNLKNLSLRLPPVASSRSTQPPSTAPAVDGARHLSAPPSPIHPFPKTGRRRPPNLTIQTPGFNRSFSSAALQAVPATPTSKPSLRHAESSPSLQSVLSPTSTQHPSFNFPRFNPAKRPLGGISLEPEIPERPKTSSQTLFAPNEPLQELGEEEDCPISRESRKGSERGYPDGPALIYDSGLYLYLEPNREEASKFDVVFNVAKEVTNPFTAVVEKQDTVMSVWKANIKETSTEQKPEPTTATSEATFVSALEFAPADTESPLTPKAGQAEPEYVHVPWDHNSEILDDLYPLCEMIDDRISKGKSVLIHCQLGVSRSASLVIAYGLYKNPHLDFNSVYDIVKERSCWVGPNMSLIYQLTDFRSKLREPPHPKKSLPAEWFENSPENRSKLRIISQQSQSIQTTTSEPEPPAPAFKRPAVDPSALFTHNPFSRTGSSTPSRRNISVRPLPLREKYQTFHSFRRSSRQDGTSVQQRAFFKPPTQMDHVMQDVPPTPSIFSPKAKEFPATPFSPSLAGDLAFPGSPEVESPIVGRSPAMNDPRSPQQRLEPFIMRNIDEFL